jgi:hypothetical protein
MQVCTYVTTFESTKVLQKTWEQNVQWAEFLDVHLIFYNSTECSD